MNKSTLLVAIVEMAEAVLTKAEGRPLDEHICRVCGCTDDRCCPGGCHWVEEDLCSKCVGKEA